MPRRRGTDDHRDAHVGGRTSARPRTRPSTGEPRASLGTLARSLAILDLFTPNAPIWTADAIAERFGYSRPTGYRYVRSLVATGLLQRLGGGLYSLGPRVIELDYFIRQTDPVLVAGLPVVRDLVADTGCEVMLVASAAGDMLTTHQEPGIERLRLTFGRGKRMPLLRGAGSRVIVAHLPAKRQREIFEQSRKEVGALRLGRDWDDFRRTLLAIRRAGFAVSRGELDAGFAGFAAPIFDRDAAILASVTIALSEKRLAIVDEDRLVLRLRTAAARISAALAALPAPGAEPRATSLEPVA